MDAPLVAVPEPKVIHVAGGRFAYLEVGASDAPVVLCLHGFPDHASTWWPVMNTLAARGYRAIAPWMRGYAPSTLAGPYDVDRLGADVCELAEALSPGRPVVVAGHDWGAVATYIAIEARPDLFRAAITMAVPHPLCFVENLPRYPRQLRRSWYILLFQLPWISDRLVTARRFALVDRLWRAWSPSLRRDPAAAAALERCLAASMPAPIEYYRAQRREIVHVRRRARALEASPIQVPTLYLQGDEDGCITAALADGQARLFRAPYRMQVLEGVGHFMQVEAPERVAVAMLEWLADPRDAG